MSQNLATFAAFPVPVLNEIFWRGLVQPRSDSRDCSGKSCFWNIGHFGRQEEELGWETGEIQHAFGVFSRPLAENENTRRDGGDFIL